MNRVTYIGIGFAGLCAAAGLARWALQSPQQQGSPPASQKSSAAGTTRLPDFDINPQPESSPIRFASVADEAGVRFQYYGNPSPRHYMTEQNGGGVGLADFDRNGELDLFLVNGSHFDHPAEEAGATNKFYRSIGGIAYEDATQAAGLEAYGFGMGCAAGDYDNDGFTDLLTCYYGRNRLWHNNGDGTFREVTARAGLGDTRWATSAAFADLDGDGRLDLYVTNYVEYSQEDPPCHTKHDDRPVRIPCGPIGRPGQADRIYRNTGDGRFRDVTDEAGIAVAEPGKGLAVQIVDLDGDGRLDIYVANDTTRNFFYRNLGDMRFEEIGLSRGAALSREGLAQSGMGIACADFNGDRNFDLFVTNFAGQVNDLYENLGGGVFHTRNAESGLDTPSRPMLAFGTVFADFDLDRYPDLFVANGHIWDLRVLESGHQYAMHPQMFRNRSGQRFVEVTAQSGPYFRKRWLGRSVAVGDLDNDGDSDLVVTHMEEPAAILRNDSDRAGKGVRLELIGVRAARRPLGIRVEVTAAGRSLATCVPAGGSFQSTSDARPLIAVGDADVLQEIRVAWPGGAEIWRDMPVRPQITLLQGTGGPAP